jgi:glycosyltransferase involved in cell wall biosynthesis
MVANHRKKIIFQIGALTGGGAERVFLTLLRHLDRGLFEPHLVLLRAEGEFFCQIPDDVVVHILSGSRRARTLPGFLLLMWRFVRLIWNIRPHAILSSGGVNLALLAVTRPVLPRAMRLLVRESSVLSVRLSCESRYPKVWRLVYRCLYRCIDAVVCQSDSMVEEMTEQFHLPEQKVLRIYNPVDCDRVRELGRSDANLYSGAGPHLVAAGRLSIEKGFDLLLAAIPKVIECLPTVRLTILGDGPLKAALAEQVQQHGLTGFVSFVGFQQNPWPYILHGDLLVVPSRREGFSNVLLEALALGKPVVAFDSPGAVREIYGKHPAVRLVRAEDSAGLAKAIVERCSETRSEQYNHEASPNWFAKFAWQQVIGEYNALFLR